MTTQARVSVRPVNNPAPRASDADRDRAAELLRAAVADGRLAPDEFDERLGAALTARTIDALASLTGDLGAAPAEVPDLVTVKEKHGTVRRDGRWALPHRLVLRTAWCGVRLDLTEAVRGAVEATIELRVRGGDVELLLAPDMRVDANDLSARHSVLAIDRDAAGYTPEALHVRVVGRIRHGRLAVRWRAPRPGGGQRSDASS